MSCSVSSSESPSCRRLGVLGSDAVPCEVSPSSNDFMDGVLSGCVVWPLVGAIGGVEVLASEDGRDGAFRTGPARGLPKGSGTVAERTAVMACGLTQLTRTQEVWLWVKGSRCSRQVKSFKGDSRRRSPGQSVPPYRPGLTYSKVQNLPSWSHTMVAYDHQRAMLAHRSACILSTRHEILHILRVGLLCHRCSAASALVPAFQFHFPPVWSLPRCSNRKIIG